MSIISVITFLFATLPTTGGTPRDLCDVVYPDTGQPIWCQPHPDGAPRFDHTVCCDTSGCVAAQRGSCAKGRAPYHCDLGEVWADGEVSCYFEVPDYCDVFPCMPGFQASPQAAGMCCYAGICWSIVPSSYDCEPQDIYWCQDGVTNSDGTVTCFDE